MDAITLDQFRIFALITEYGSFSAVARKLNRGQSAITYTIKKLEDQTGLALFSRGAYRPVLTDAGKNLLPRIKRILEEVDAFKVQAHSLSLGLEPELSIVVDSMVPMPLLVDALAGFQKRYPAVQTRVLVETLGAAVNTLMEGRADFGLVIAATSESSDLVRVPFGEITLVPVVAPHHPLAKMKGLLEADHLRDHIQLVLTDRTSPTSVKDQGVAATRTWRIADLGAKHAMLISGLGWGSMPNHMVAADLKTGRLIQLKIKSWDGDAKMPRLPIVVAHRRDKALGPSGEWLFKCLTSSS